MMRKVILLCLACVLLINAEEVEKLPKVRPSTAACNEYQKGFHNEGVKSNGKKAILKEFPYVVSLKYMIEGDLTHVCSGALITTKHILTAAHCFNNINERLPVQALLGAITLNDTSNNVQTRTISKVISHPKFRRSQQYYDIGIVELSTPINITEYVQPVCLQDEFSYDLSLSLSAVGWGRNFDSEEIPNDLLKAQKLSLVERIICDSFYTNLAKLSHGIDDSMICILNQESNDDYCSEGGAPLVQKNNNSIHLLGVKSFDMGCEGNAPPVYTSIYDHLDWIEKMVWPEKK